MKTLSQLKAEMERCGLGGYFSATKSHARGAVRIDYAECDETDIPVGASKLGGFPDLPPEVSWFYNPETGAPLSFLCQIDLAEASAYAEDGALPSSGLLSFFYDCSGDASCRGAEPGDAAGVRVFYNDGDPWDLRRTSAPINLEKYGVLFAPASLTFDGDLELPGPDSVYGEGVQLPEDEEERLGRLCDERLEIQSNKLLGYPDSIQGPMEMSCQLVSNGLNCDAAGYEQGKALGLESGAAEWKLLLQLDSNEDLGMMWGDCGRLYFFIREEDLARGDFEKVRMIMQCY